MQPSIRFGSLRLGSNAKKYIPVEGYTTSASYNTDENEQPYGKPTLTKKGATPIPIGFDVTLDERLGIDVEYTVDTLIDLCEAGTSQFLYRNGRLESKNRFLLETVDIGDVFLSPEGRMLSCKASLSFLEDPGSGTSWAYKDANKRSR